MIVSFLTQAQATNSKGKAEKKETSELLGELFVIVILRPAFTVLFGWIIMQFM